MQIFIYNLLRKFLSQESRNKLKSSLFKLKVKNKKLLQFVYGVAGDDELFDHLVKKLGDNYDILMIHSSFNNMLPMYIGNLKKFLNKLVAYCDKNSITLAMPAFFFGAENFDPAKYYEENEFNVISTHSQMGILTELFRHMPDVKRSIHPTHSVCAYGKLAEKITKDHHLADTSCGIGTPFGYMYEYRTKILGLGTKYYRTLTQIHLAEDILKENFPVTLKYEKIIPITCIDADGNKFIYSLPVNQSNYTRDASRVKKILTKKELKVWKYKGILLFLTEAKAVTDVFIDAARRGETIYRKS